MSASDSVIPLSLIDGSLLLASGGTESVTVPFIQTEWNWTEETAPWTEAKTRALHHSTPVARKVGAGSITGSLMALVATLKGSTAASLYEWLTFTGSASGYTGTALGDKKALRATLTGNASAAGGATQSYIFAYCIFSNVKIEPGGADGLWTISADFTDMEESPTIA